jgi:hypothetical protein
MVLEDVSDHQDPFLLARQPHQLLSLGNGQRQWLLNENILSGQQALPAQSEMSLCWSGNDNSLNGWFAIQVAQ